MSIGKTARENPTLALVLFFLLVLMGPLGSISATLVQLVLLISIPFVFREVRFAEILRQPLIATFFATYFALALAFIAATGDPVAGLHSINFLAVLLAAPLFVLGRKLEHRDLWQLVSGFALLGLLVTLALVLFQTTALGLPRAEGYASNANIIARYALVTGFVCLVGVRTFTGNLRFLFLLGPFLGVIICLLSGSRGAFLALPVFMLAAVGFLLADFARRVGTIRIALLVFVLACVSLIGLVLMSDRLFQLGKTVSDVMAGNSAGEAVDVRLDMYVAGWRAFLDQPIFGYGWPNIVSAANDALSPTARTSSLLAYRHLHNDFLNFAVGGGLVGVLAWLTFLLAPLIWTWNIAPGERNSSARFVLFLLPCALFVFGATDMSIGYDVMTVVYFCLIYLALSTVRQTAQ
ncbi:O-antigen ligase family protein [Maritalea porphyrae]|uniref:O-antigen ligase family protein n=1 Tax=Maritalea porphyrae TaxID=880732 RepID=UPI0022AF2B9A|nr:O-antigen ligase family protein [Maritalea porphyrae]MCZ4271889.1 O-antigen ligase family protein [Maritalea porphyrae]